MHYDSCEASGVPTVRVRLAAQLQVFIGAQSRGGARSDAPAVPSGDDRFFHNPHGRRRNVLVIVQLRLEVLLSLTKRYARSMNDGYLRAP
jgi:hypothetical protein